MKKFIIAVIFVFNLCCSCCFATGEVPKLGSIDFDIQVNSNGLLNVTETWKINEFDSNILYVNLQTKSTEVSDIKVFRDNGDNIIEFISGDFSEDTIKTGSYSVIESGENPVILLRNWKIQRFQCFIYRR